MEGHLYQRGKSNIWYLLYDAPADGKKRNLRSVRIGNMPKAEADAKKREILSAVDKGMAREQAASTSVEAFLNSWIEATQDRLAPRTAERYASIVKLHIVPIVGNVKLARLTPEHVRKIYRGAKERGLSDQTCLHVHRALHTALQYGVREERILNENVVGRVKAPTVERRERAPLNREQIRFLMAAAKGTRLEVPTTVAALTGLRRGELLALRWQHLDLDKGSLFVAASLEHSRAASDRIRFKGPKSKTSRRVIPLAPECVALLRSHKAGQEEEKSLAGDVYVDNDLAFPNPDGCPWPPDTFTTQFSKLAASVGMRGFRFHDLRHAFASIALADGVSIKEVQTLMGHSSPVVTLSVYARSIEGLGRQAVNELARSLLVPERA
ncbi:MAG TPA: site-specific integrase [Candidatus Cybelea sp.]